MKTWKPIVGVCLIFILGMVAGGLVSRAIVLKKVHDLIRRGPEGIREIIVERLDRKLQLDSAQRAQLEVIVDKTQSDLRTIHQETQPRVAHCLDNAEEGIRSILRPDQAKRFDKWVNGRKAEGFLQGKWE